MLIVSAVVLRFSYYFYLFLRGSKAGKAHLWELDYGIFGVGADFARCRRSWKFLHVENCRIMNKLGRLE